MKLNVEKIMMQIKSSDSDVRWEASKKLSKIGGTKIIEFLILLLEDTDSEIRNLAALTLKNIGDNIAVKPIVKAIKNSTNVNNRGTLVHALEGFDCKEYFLLMVELSLYGNIEVQSHALNILNNQCFNVTKEEIKKARMMVKKYLKQQNKCKNYKVLINELTNYINDIDEES